MNNINENNKHEKEKTFNKLDSKSTKKKSSKKNSPLSSLQKSISEKIKTSKQKKQQQKQQEAQIYYENARKKFDELDGNAIVSFGKNYLLLENEKRFIRTRLILIALIIAATVKTFEFAGNKILDYTPRNLTVVQKVDFNEKTLILCDIDKNYETIEKVITLDNNKDALINDKIKVGSSIVSGYRSQSNANNIFAIDEIKVR